MDFHSTSKINQFFLYGYGLNHSTSKINQFFFVRLWTFIPHLKSTSFFCTAMDFHSTSKINQVFFVRLWTFIPHLKSTRFFLYGYWLSFHIQNQPVFFCTAMDFQSTSKINQFWVKPVVVIICKCHEMVVVSITSAVVSMVSFKTQKYAPMRNPIQSMWCCRIDSLAVFKSDAEPNKYMLSKCIWYIYRI